MRRNKRYTKEEMYLAIEIWQESGIKQKAFCDRENLSLATFAYWLKKYKKEKESFTDSGSTQTFIPVEVPSPKAVNPSLLNPDKIEVCFPNGVNLSCPAGIDIGQLKNLINF